jgi:hypothetical protein
MLDLWSSGMASDNRDETEFILVEYRESANAYFKGVEIGWTGLRSYLTINALFAALLGALSEPKGQLMGASEVAKLVPFFALVASLAIVAVCPYYFMHLENCRKRCEEIEKLRGGKFFTNLGVIAAGKSKVKSKGVLFMLVGSVVVFWCYFGVKSYFPDVSLSQFFYAPKSPS